MSLVSDEMRKFAKPVPVNRLVPGDRLAHDVCLGNGVLLIRASARLTQNAIDTLIEMGPKAVMVDLLAVYKRSIAQSKLLMKKAAEGKQLSVSEVEALVQPFVVETKRETNIVRLLSQLETQDEYTFQHTVSIGVLSMVIGDWLGHSRQELSDIAVAGTLHDIGKSQIPKDVIYKPGRLTKTEFDIMKRHPKLGLRILEYSGGYKDCIKQAVLQHHERLDGSGYPDGVRGDEQHPYAKIVAVADVYHAMTSKRPYKGKSSPYTVLEHLQESIGTLDARTVLVFVDRMLQCLAGCKVTLSDGRIGDVVFVDKDHLGHPVIRVGQDTIDLHEHEDLTITEVVKLQDV